MAYQALYRQWRPRDFSHMVGQEAIVETLRNQIRTGRIAHAYLFCGSRGTGKTSTAKILAKAVNCEHPRDGDPCGECDPCRRAEAGETLDIVEIDAASNNGVDEIRSLRETVKYPPQFGKYKVYIIDEVHMLSTGAFNALLKTLEEPPEHVIFLLATTEPQKLPATILSRCQRYDFGRIPAALIQGRLREAAEAAGATATNGALMAIARAAEGGMRDALSILDMCLGTDMNVTEALVRSVLGTSDRAFLFRFSAALAEENAAEVLKLVNELMRAGRDPTVFSREVSAHLRALLMAQCCGEGLEELLEMTAEDAEEYLRESGRFTASRLMDMQDLFLRLEGELRYAGSPRVALENTALKCCLRTEAPDTLAINDRLAELDNRLTHLSDQIASGAVTVREPAAAPAPAKEKAPAKARKAEEKPKTLTPTGRSTDEIWRAALTELLKKEPGIGTNLNSLGTFLGSADGETFRWQSNIGFDIIATQMNREKNKVLIEQALTAAAGFPCRFIAVDTKAEREKREEESDEKYVDSLKGVFGAEAVVVEES